jgi:Mg2+/Co2+ transporter CorC
MPHINTNEFDWKSLARAVFVPENKKARQFIKGFSEYEKPFGSVVDEYGGTSGLVSLEDVMKKL